MEELTPDDTFDFVLGDFVDYVGLYESFFGLCIGDQEPENRTRTKSDPYGHNGRSTICGKGCIWLARCKFSEYPACCLCVVCTLFIYVGWQLVAVYTFGVALLLLVISLAISIRELLISVKALEYRLDNVKIKKEGEESC